jgi:hypothetical protein
MQKIVNKYYLKRNCAATVPISTFMSVRGLYIPPIDLPILLQENMGTYPWKIEITHRHINVKIGTEAAQFSDKEYINGILVAVCLAYNLSSQLLYVSSIELPLVALYFPLSVLCTLFPFVNLQSCTNTIISYQRKDDM